jgi:ThiF family
MIVRPKLHEFVAAGGSRTVKQLEVLGADAQAVAEAKRTTIALSLPRGANASRRLLAMTLLDYVLRLDPLVREVQLEGFDERAVLELATRVPLEIIEHGAAPDLRAAVGASQGSVDLIIDGVGWLAGVGETLEEIDSTILNPIGPCSAAALGAGEIFKTLFKLNHPDAPHSRRFLEAAGVFSFYDYRYGGESPPLDPMRIDATLVGLGGVGAGVVTTIAAIGSHIIGVLRLVDADRLSRDNMNRVTYSRCESAATEVEKVVEAAHYLRSRTQDLDIREYPVTFAQFKRELALRREDRSYDVLITGLDDDLVRHEVQRELPRVLIDGATGRDANIIVDRVLLGGWGCLGCTRQIDPVAGGDAAGCDDFPDENAPSVSFLSAFPGILAAGELMKEAIGGHGSLAGSFEHIFIYGPNEDLVCQAAVSPTCRVGCGNANVRAAYALKYGAKAGHEFNAD